MRATGQPTRTAGAPWIFVVCAALFIVLAGWPRPRAESAETQRRAPNSAFCFLCHAGKKTTWSASGHGQFDLTCDMCHNSHFSGVRMLLVAEARDLCYNCHGNIRDHFGTSGHGQARMTCSMCHDPHGTPEADPD